MRNVFAFDVREIKDYLTSLKGQDTPFFTNPDYTSNTPLGVYRKEYFLRFVIDLSVLDVREIKEM